MNLTFEIPIHFTGRGRRRRSLRSGPEPALAPLPEGTVPRIARLMALAVHFDRLLASGAVGSLASLARRFRVTRARMSQIMALNRLAPEMQEALLFLPRTVSGRAVLTERELRAVAAEEDWGRQREILEKDTQELGFLPPPPVSRRHRCAIQRSCAGTVTRGKSDASANLSANTTRCRSCG